MTPQAPTAAPLLSVNGLRKTYRLPGGGRLTAADDITFSVPAGGSLGIVGESGSGKTTVARMLVGLVSPDAGTVTVSGQLRAPGAPRGRKARLARARQIQMVFQDPYVSLDPRLTARQCVTTALRLHGREAKAADGLLDQVGLGAREADAGPHRLSGGQRQRLAIARALAVEPRVLVLDEAVAALDVSIQAQILQLLGEIRDDTGVALVFVSHDLAVVHHITDEVVVMRHGTVVEQGPTADVLAGPRHPYTRLLLASVPRAGWDPADAVTARAAMV
ncbi:ATP-binding cassette domain-containing protein [Streptomyces sp. SID4919]|uniref:ABC transporter ATP-binding protein n=1 Tax=unclassified Streptomyces TaxID=2593676 RepID=UPI000823E831|nr:MULTISPECIES: ATP-binding cassette domain-containing protein [unclassified Streptomyces]MYY10673.1 ATP-binding cassette domain-containing protein [Streptomyces sp. SID4919]SCK62927.1 peptide/nickel transport system ATP-binding protein [Streptomyces sp. AmelKG-E11A]